MRHYLALDQAPRKIGFAFGSPDMEKPVAVGVVRLPVVGARHGVMLAQARDWLDRHIKIFHVEKVCFETPFMGKNAQVFAVANKLIGVIELVCEDHGIPCVEAAAPEWRGRFINCTQAPRSIPKHRRRAWLKEQAMKACAARGWEVDGDDAAEACGILDYMLALDFPQYGTSAGAPLFASGDAA